MSAETEIRRRIKDRGAITFAEFMELALFWPGGGYYLAGDPIGSPGDYYTSPQVHPAFGALLAVQLYQMWQILDRPDPFTVVEMGAGNGILCRDLVTYSHGLPPGFEESLRYVCLDRRAVAGLETHLPKEARAGGVSRLAAAGLPFRRIRGCLLSNEYLDAFPVHQVTMRDGKLQEILVTVKGEELTSCLSQPSDPELSGRFEELGIELAEGQTAELCLGLNSWAQDAADCLDAGFVLTVDYGHEAAELYSSERRRRGTLTTYYRHTQTDAPFERIGRQDMTAQVDFSTLVHAGRRAGLEPLGLITQGRFLYNLGLGSMSGRLGSMGLTQKETKANRAGMLDLARMGGLGDFKVLVQGKGVGESALWGLTPSPEATDLIEGAPVPRLTAEHLPWLEGRYPTAEVEWEGYLA